MKGQNLVEWSDNYFIKITLIDEQHKKLLAMINDLYMARHKNEHTDFVRTIKKYLRGVI